MLASRAEIIFLISSPRKKVLGHASQRSNKPKQQLAAFALMLGFSPRPAAFLQTDVAGSTLDNMRSYVYPCKSKGGADRVAEKKRRGGNQKPRRLSRGAV